MRARSAVVKTGKPEKLDPFEDIKIANAVKKLILDLLKALVKSTDNTIDDKIVEYIEVNLWPKEQ